MPTMLPMPFTSSSTCGNNWLSTTSEMNWVGDIPEKDSMEKELRTFIQNVYVINPKAEFNRSPITAICHLPYDLMTYFIK